jgi:hypothetical protein
MEAVRMCICNTPVIFDPRHLRVEKLNDKIKEVKQTIKTQISERQTRGKLIP